jgi:hypothetical protein
MRTKLLPLLALIPWLMAQDYNVPFVPRPAAGGSAFCPSATADLFCEDWGATSDACTGEDTAPTAAGTVSCDCTTSANCINATRPPSIPYSQTECLEQSHETDSADDNLTWSDTIDDADAYDTQYFRFSMYLASSDADEDTFRSLLILYTGGTTLWQGGSSTNVVVQILANATPQVRFQSTDGAATSPMDFPLTTWTEFTGRIVESTCVVELCKNAPTGSSTCAGASSDNCCYTIDGDNCPASTAVDGMRLHNRYSSPTSNVSSRFSSVLRWSSSAFGATGT